jgi:hypothetical protein
MKAYTGSRGIASFILNLSTRWRWVVNCTPRLLYRCEEPWDPLNNRMGGLQSRPGCSGRGEKSHVPTSIQKVDHPVCSLVTTLTTRLSFLWRS